MTGQLKDSGNVTTPDRAAPSQPSETPASKQLRLSWQKKVLFLGVLFVGLLLFAEGMLRVYFAVRGWTPNCYAAQLQLLAPHPLNGYELAKNFELRSGVFHIQTNALGLRGPEIATVKPDGITRIAIIGGSSVFGYLVNDGQEAARLLEQQLNDSDIGKFEVLNAGVPGYDLFQSVRRFREIIAPLQPDIVVVYAGFNDIPYLLSATPEKFGQPRKCPHPAWERILGRTALYGFVAYRLAGKANDFGVGRRTNGVPCISGIEQFESNLNELRSAAEEIGATMVICSQATAAQGDVAEELRKAVGNSEYEIQCAANYFVSLRASLRLVASQNDLKFIDVFEEIPPTSEYLGDAIHLTVKGEQRLADILTRELKPVIEMPSAGTIE